MKINFVCTGNICRSPTAEAIARHKAKELDLENNFSFDSSGIQSFHAGEDPDYRSMEVGKRRGISFVGIKARKFENSDFSDFDLIMAMDRGHYSYLKQIAPKEFQDKVKLFLEYCDVKNSWNNEVKDPYYSSDKSFDEVYDLIELAVEKMIKKIS